MFKLTALGHCINAMSDRPDKILLVEPDAAMLETLVTALARRFDAHITCVADAVSCLDVEMLDPHDVVICEMGLPDANGLKLVDRLKALSQRPVILIADDVSSDEAIAAMRCGAVDLFRRPLAVDGLLETVERVLQEFSIVRKRAAKTRRLRELVRHVVRERRELNHRMELICRDLVQAQRRLVHRVLAIEEQRTR